MSAPILDLDGVEAVRPVCRWVLVRPHRVPSWRPADQLVHVDEPGAPATLEQLRTLLPSMIPEHLAALQATGIVEPCQPDRYCIPSPSLLQLAIDARAAGISAPEVLDLLGEIRQAADTAAHAVVRQIGRPPDGTDPEILETFLQRGRGLLPHGVGRLTPHRIGQELGIAHETSR